jgi:DNA (cytosine-5)-methyltransferase 1
MSSNEQKPLYRVPLMSEIAALPWNGFKVASTFSGGGGSCTGYRMAGFKVVWANEFVPAAQESYRANHPETFLDCRDIKNVTAEDVMRDGGLKPGELDLFDGSPPCQAFSTAGKREKGWGKDKTYEHGAKQKNETLFGEYIRLLKGLQPKTFVAENVSGLAKGTAKGWFLEILRDLKACGYVVTCRQLDAQWLGVPQSRSRLIFVGVREDLELQPAHPSPLSYRYSVRDALPWIVKAESGPTGFGVGSQRADIPAPTVSASMQAPYGDHHVTAARRGRIDDAANPCPTVLASNAGFSDLAVEMIVGNDAFAPKWGPVDSGPCPTIMAGGPHGGSGEIRNLATMERRKFTIAEVKRICSFPDDYVLTGSYAQQWERLGNSVPPVMMSHIARTIRDEILMKIPRSPR